MTWLVIELEFYLISFFLFSNHFTMILPHFVVCGRFSKRSGSTWKQSFPSKVLCFAEDMENEAMAGGVTGTR